MHLCQQKPAIYNQQAAGHVVGSRTGEEEHSLCDVVRNTHPLQRNARGESLQDGIGGRATRTRRLDTTRSDGVDQDMVRAKFQRQRFRYLDYPTFGGVVMHEVWDGGHR